MRRVKAPMSAGASAPSISRKSLPHALAFTNGIVLIPSSFPVHRPNLNHASQPPRFPQLLQHAVLLTPRSLDVKLHAPVLARISGKHVQHDAVYAFQNAIHFLADLLHAASRGL